MFQYIKALSDAELAARVEMMADHPERFGRLVRVAYLHEAARRIRRDGYAKPDFTPTTLQREG